MRQADFYKVANYFCIPKTCSAGAQLQNKYTYGFYLAFTPPTPICTTLILLYHIKSHIMFVILQFACAEMNIQVM